MIDILQPGHGNAYVVESTLSLTITVNGVGNAYIDRYRNRSLIDQTTLTDGQSKTFGPYNVDLSFVINATGCPVTVTKQEVLQSMLSADVP